MVIWFIQDTVADRVNHWTLHPLKDCPAIRNQLCIPWNCLHIQLGPSYSPSVIEQVRLSEPLIKSNLIIKRRRIKILFFLIKFFLRDSIRFVFEQMLILKKKKLVLGTGNHEHYLICVDLNYIWSYNVLWRNVLGTRTLGEILADREKIASEMQVDICFFCRLTVMMIKIH